MQIFLMNYAYNYSLHLSLSFYGINLFMNEHSGVARKLFQIVKKKFCSCLSAAFNSDLL